ncbi:hypothetical protein EW146_g10279, partial [Bondarzewia mesenterica]
MARGEEVVREGVMGAIEVRGWRARRDRDQERVCGVEEEERKEEEEEEEVLEGAV